MPSLLLKIRSFCLLILLLEFSRCDYYFVRWFCSGANWLSFRYVRLNWFSLVSLVCYYFWINLALSYLICSINCFSRILFSFNFLCKLDFSCFRRAKLLAALVWMSLLDMLRGSLLFSWLSLCELKKLILLGMVSGWTGTPFMDFIKLFLCYFASSRSFLILRNESVGSVDLNIAAC